MAIRATHQYLDIDQMREAENKDKDFYLSTPKGNLLVVRHSMDVYRSIALGSNFFWDEKKYGAYHGNEQIDASVFEGGRKPNNTPDLDPVKDQDPILGPGETVPDMYRPKRGSAHINSLDAENSLRKMNSGGMIGRIPLSIFK